MAIEKIFKDDATEEKGERARMASFVGAIAITDLVKTTLGPKGMDKILQSTGRGHGVTVTNDGATILKSLHIDNPAAKVLIDISKVQDDEVGDGTTSVVVLAGELLREAEKLVAAKIHPMTIISGYRMAAECARSALLQRVVDNKEDAEKFKSDLMKIAMTTLSSKILSQDKEHFAQLAVDAVMRLKGSTNLEAIQIIKKPGGSLKDSFLDEGFILDKKIGLGQPKRIENAKILVANTAMDTDKVKIYGARVRVDSMSKVAEIEGAEKEKMREKVQKIIAHGINCFVNRQLIYNFPEELFADAGILAIEHADFDGIERLALVTGGDIASTFDNPESVKLGHCKVIEEIMIGEDKLIHFSGVEMGQACTIVLRGASHHMLDEAERSLHDALCVLSQTVNDTRVLLGGGWPEMIMSKEVDELARKTPGKKSHAIEAFSRALVAIPTIIADNAGLDSADLVAQLRAAHHKEGCNAGIDVISATTTTTSMTNGVRVPAASSSSANASLPQSLPLPSLDSLVSSSSPPSSLSSTATATATATAAATATATGVSVSVCAPFVPLFSHIHRICSQGLYSTWWDQHIQQQMHKPDRQLHTVWTHVRWDQITGTLTPELDAKGRGVGRRVDHYRTIVEHACVFPTDKERLILEMAPHAPGEVDGESRNPTEELPRYHKFVTASRVGHKYLPGKVLAWVMSQANMWHSFVDDMVADFHAMVAEPEQFKYVYGIPATPEYTETRGVGGFVTLVTAGWFMSFPPSERPQHIYWPEANTTDQNNKLCLEHITIPRLHTPPGAFSLLTRLVLDRIRAGVFVLLGIGNEQGQLPEVNQHLNLPIQQRDTKHSYRITVYDRRDARKRVWLNSVDLLSRIAPHHRVLYIDKFPNLSTQDQLRVYANTDILIAEHGAGQMATLFLPRGAISVQVGSWTRTPYGYLGGLEGPDKLHLRASTVGCATDMMDKHFKGTRQPDKTPPYHGARNEENTYCDPNTILNELRDRYHIDLER